MINENEDSTQTLVSDEIQKSHSFNNNLSNDKPKIHETSKQVDKLNSDDEISMSEFLEFLKTACQIHDIIFFGESKFFGEPNLNEIANNNIFNKILGTTIKQRISELAKLYENNNNFNNITTISTVAITATTNTITITTTGTTSTVTSTTLNNMNGQSTNSSLMRKRSISQCGANTLKNTLNKLKLESTLALSSAAATSTSGCIYGRGINPGLKKRLDEFIDQGIIDSLLPHICPINNYNTTDQTSALINFPIISSINNNNNNPISNVNTNNNPLLSNLNSSSLNNSSSSSASKTLKLSSKAKENQNFNGKNGQQSPKQSTDATFDNNNMNTGIVEKNKSSTSLQKSDEKLVDKIRVPKTADTVYKIKEHKTILRRKSLASGLGSRDSNDTKKLGESEVIIHVCDEVKNTSKDFSCPQNLLVNKMKYFADVTGGQKLEDMDISVHCDIQIFEWLMRWVKKDMNHQSNPDANTVSPQLDATNVIPILVSASFLQMEPLLLDCLSFCHSRLNDVVRTSTNLSCLNDAIITRLAAMFTNLELEMVKDKKERVTPRLWTKLIQSLMEPEPQALRGHYFSLTGLYKCQKCSKYVTHSAATYVCCSPANIRINRWGQFVSQHVKDPQWDINTFIVSLYKELKSWRKVYWKLWGHCHYLYCCICETYFPVYQMNWCLYHPEPAQFLGPVTEGHTPGPAGRFPCCGQQAFRFETLIGPNGCQYREHSVLVETDRDRAILALAQIAAEGCCLTESPKSKSNLQFGTTFEPLWVGMSLMPTKCRQGLLPTIQFEELNAKFVRRGKPPITYLESSSDTESSNSYPMGKGKFSNHELSGSTDGCESESSSEKNYKTTTRRRRTARCAKTFGRYWCGEVSARSNQDNQREFEEKVMKQIMSIVSKKNGNDNNGGNLNSLNGGSYVRLETEWKEQLRLKNLSKIKTKF